MADTAALSWVVEDEEPWTRYRALLDLEHRPPHDPTVVESYERMRRSAEVRGVLDRAAEWPGYPLKRHNDAAHPLYAVSTLADFGLHRDIPSVAELGDSILAGFDGDQFETLLWLPRFLTKDTEDVERRSWILCDSPTLLYALLAFGYGDDPRVQRAVEVVAGLIGDNGWRCSAATNMPRFSGPGRRHDACPLATTISLKALSLVPAIQGSPVIDPGIDTLLAHWEHQADYKLKMFGIGTDFRKLKYPFVWYDILHVADVLSRFQRARSDSRLVEMVSEIERQADLEGRYTATSMYRPWTGWSFADKRKPSAWLTMVVLRIRDRMDSQP